MDYAINFIFDLFCRVDSLASAFSGINSAIIATVYRAMIRMSLQISDTVATNKFLVAMTAIQNTRKQRSAIY